jgi:hypothetical protein
VAQPRGPKALVPLDAPLVLVPPAVGRASQTFSNARMVMAISAIDVAIRGVRSSRPEREEYRPASRIRTSRNTTTVPIAKLFLGTDILSNQIFANLESVLRALLRSKDQLDIIYHEKAKDVQGKMEEARVNG